MARYRTPPPNLVKSITITNVRLSKLEQAPRAVATAVDSGSWKFVADNGVEIIKYGEEVPGFGRGWIFRRGENGRAAFYLGGSESSNQYWVLQDNTANIVVSDDANSQQGLARPYIPYTYIVTNGAGAGTSTTSTSFVNAYNIRGYKQHPRIDIEYLISTPAGVSAEVQIVDTNNSNTIIDGPVTHGPSSSSFSGLRGTLSGSHVNPINVNLQFRVSSGAGTIGITLTYAYGIQS